MKLNQSVYWFRTIIDKLTLLAVVIGGIFTGIMTIIVGYAVVGRYILNRPIGWSEEISMYLVVWAVFLGAAYTLKEDGHIGVDVVVARLKPSWKRAVFIFHHVVGIVFFSILLYKGSQFVTMSIQMGALSESIEFPLYIAQLSVPVGAAILILQSLNKLLEQCKGGS